MNEISNKDMIISKDDKLYNQEYGHLPDDQLGCIEHILGGKLDNVKFNKNIEDIAKKIHKIKWKKIKITLWKIIKPSPRPRARNLGYIHMYVPGARESGDWFAVFSKEKKLPIIDTPCILNLKIFGKTPDSWSIKKRVLAEMGYWRPWNNTGDFDNYAKAVADFIQHGMLKNDALVIDASQHLYYSIKPHAEIELIYMESFPEC